MMTRMVRQMARGTRSRFRAATEAGPQRREAWELRPSLFKRAAPPAEPLGPNRGRENAATFDAVTFAVGLPQEALPWLPSRAGWGFENLSAESLWVHPERGAPFDQWTLVAPGQRFERQGWSVPTTAIFVIGGAAGLRFRAWTWSW